ncbi:MAG: nonstructural protein [Microvirus sp.]|nr:MAG: nonstructural protein [Microvirus sp.]
MQRGKRRAKLTSLADDPSSSFPEREHCMNKRLYMVYDLVANTVLGGIMLENADAPAMRAFNDALGNKESLLGQHPKDFNLLYLGEIAEDGTIHDCGPDIIATGASWSTLRETENA